jgi:hypothetical protein
MRSLKYDSKPQPSLRLKWIFCLLLLCSFAAAKADDLKLAQVYINLTLANENFDKLGNERLNKMVPYLESELKSITEQTFINENRIIYNMSYSNLYYLKARILFKNKTEINRGVLTNWKDTLGKAIQFYNDCNLYETCIKKNYDDNTDGFDGNSYYDLTGFNKKSCENLSNGIKDLKFKFNPYFNNDIYPDFQDVFFKAKADSSYDFKEPLKKITNLYNMPIFFSILENDAIDKTDRYADISPKYYLNFKLDLVSQYLQLNYIAKNQDAVKSEYALYDNYFTFLDILKPSDTLNFKYENPAITKDAFFNAELNTETSKAVYEQLQKKFPYNYVKQEEYDLASAMGNSRSDPLKYYFPTPAPQPSAKLSITHFKSALTTLKQTNAYISKCFFDAGYSGRLHYYFIKEGGYAISTELEKIEKTGAPSLPDAKRWNLTISDNGKLSLYEVFKAIFFLTESDYRIICCIVSPKEITCGKPINIKEMAILVSDDHSYTSFPPELENVVLPDKTLTVLVYHFCQSDVGEVPILQTKIIKAEDHLKKTSSLSLLIR